MKHNCDTDVIRKKTWKEFRDTGLLTFVNTFLHIFGWAIVLEMKDEVEDEVIGAFPARTAFKGFSEDVADEAYKKVSSYLYNYGSKAIYEASHGVLDEEEL